jgi:crotonobetainyl-CoA:carnitine CoA-transferase CaiB-like acyl-CoA transferase
MANNLLSNLRALDLTDEKGFVCGKVLAVLGVDVLKVEPPEGCPARTIPPLCHGADGLELGLYWLAFNSDKRGITLNVETNQGQALFRRLVEKTDFVIESFPPGYLDGIGLGYKSLERINPKIIMVSITPFGQRGPYSHYKACELVISAMSGVLGDNGEPDRPPVKEALNSIYFEGGSAAALGAVIAYYNREAAGEGQHVDVSMQHVTASRDLTAMHIFEFDKKLLKRTGDKGQVGGRRIFRWLWPCKDGHLFWSLRGGHIGLRINETLSRWLDAEGLENPYKGITDLVQFDVATISEETRAVFERAIGKLFLRYTKKEIIERALGSNAQAWPISNIADVLENPQLAARNYWQVLSLPGPGIEFRTPRHFLLSSETENYVRRPAPAIGEHNNEVYGKELGLSESKMKALKKAGVI